MWINTKARVDYEPREAIAQLFRHDILNTIGIARVDMFLHRHGNNEKLLREMLWVRYGDIANQLNIFSVSFNASQNCLDVHVSHPSLYVVRDGEMLHKLSRDFDEQKFRSRLSIMDGKFSLA